MNIRSCYLLFLMIYFDAAKTYCMWNWASSFFYSDEAEQPPSSNASLPKKNPLKPGRFLLAGTASQTKLNGINENRFITAPSKTTPLNNHHCWLFGLFDGYNNQQASQFLQELFPSILESNFKNTNQLQNSIKLTFSNINETLALPFVSQNVSGMGSTALIVIIFDENPKKLHIAHVGDSLALLKTNADTQLLTMPHTLNNPQEASRIDECYQIPHRNNDPIISFYGKEQFEQMNCTTYLRETNMYSSYPIQLKITRGIGFSKFKPNIIPEPEFFESNVEPSYRFLILATESFWNVMTSQVAVSRIEEYIDSVDNPNQLDPEAIAQDLVREVWNLNPQNNITLTIIFFIQNIWLQKFGNNSTT